MTATRGPGQGWQHAQLWNEPSMGGTLTIVGTVPVDREDLLPAAQALGGSAAARVEAWAGRLTRFNDASDLSRLNGDPSSTVPVRRTLAAVLSWAREAAAITGALVDVTLLPERLAAESRHPLRAPSRPTGRLSWTLVRHGRRAVVGRAPGVSFDLDGVAKGWLADRALALLLDLPGAIVDADGDIAIRVAAGDEVAVGVARPEAPAALIASLRLQAPLHETRVFGVATSGVTVHRWGGAGADRRHHLIDPRTGRPAETDLVQATVVAGSARVAEALAKAAVILGRLEGLAFLEAAGVGAGIVVTAQGDCLATTGSLSLLAA